MSKTEEFNALAKTFTSKKLPESEVELTGEIPADVVAPYREKALSLIASELDIPGFRKGHVPADMAVKKVGEVALLEEAVELLMHDFYPALVETHAAEAVGRPDIRITKLAPGNPVGIIIRTSVYPAVEVPRNWKKLGEGVEIETVPDILDAELDEALTSIRRARAKADVVPEQEPAQNLSSGSGEPGEGSASASAKLAIPENIPELNDEFAKSLGQFEGVEDLKQKLRDNMKQEKEQKSKDARRGKIIEALLAETKLDVPAIFVESELEKIINQMKEDTSRFGLSFEDYLKRVEKDEAQVRAEFREQATKRAKLQLILNKLAEEEKVEADQEAVETELKHAMEHFPDARLDLVRIHIETVLRNEKVLQILEKGE